ncbi:hypothetical protein As57867_003093, partial [Aphanomyces stellatus]
MALIWSKVLNVDVNVIGPNTSFFALGGDSISGIRVVAACKQEGLSISISEILKGSILTRVALSACTQMDVAWPQATLPETLLTSISNDWGTVLNLGDYIVYPVTSLQGGMIFATINNREAYVAQYPFVFDKAFDERLLVSSFKTLVERIDILRTTFIASTSGIHQIIRKDILDLEVTTESTSNIDEFLKADLARGFELGNKYFHRLTIVESNSQRYGVLTIHHALYDGWAMSMLLNELTDIMLQKKLTDRPSFCKVVDYIESQDTNATEAYWRSYLNGAVSVPIGLAIEKTKYLDDMTIVPLEATMQLTAISAIARSVGVTVAELTKLAWAATLRKYTRNDDVIFGQVMANRDIPVQDADRILGPLLSTVPCRVRFDDTTPLPSLLRSVQSERGSMMGHAYASLSNIKRWCGIDGELFDTLFTFQNLPDGTIDGGMDGLCPLKPPHSSRSNDFAVEIIVTPNPSSLLLDALHNPNVFSASQVNMLLNEFDYTLSQLCHGLHSELSTDSLWQMSPLQHQLITEASHGQQLPLPHELLHHAYESQVDKNPNIRAIEYEDDWLSYGELNAQANTLAVELANMGVCVGSRVAVVIERCLEFPIGLLAALKVGAAIMTLDATFPPKRLEHMLLDANAHVVLTMDKYHGMIENMDMNIQVLYFKANVLGDRKDVLFKPHAHNIATRDNEAFIVYTSGSTGKPKGVPVLHRGAVNVMMHMTMPGIRPGARAMQFMAIGFDVCQWEIWCTLSFGATLVLRSSNVFDTISKVEIAMMTPTGLALLGHPDQYPNLKCIQVAGESVPTSLKDLWASRVCLKNCYGPSECAVITNTVQLRTDYAVTIGPPIPNVSTYILDDSQRLVPVGVVGEIYLGGICVSPCYINLPEQTAERFLDNPFAPGQMYRTGDLGRMLPNGDFEILGRKDTQVKLKGYRIELEEVAEA